MEGGCTCVPGLNFKTCCFLYFILFFIFALSFVAVTISTDVFFVLFVAILSAALYRSCAVAATCHLSAFYLR